MSALETALAAVEQALAKWHSRTAAAPMSEDYDRARLVRLEADATLTFDLTAAGATVVVASEAKIRLAGLVATSTQGLQAAVRNWVANAGKRLDQEQDQ